MECVCFCIKVGNSGCAVVDYDGNPCDSSMVNYNFDCDECSFAIFVWNVLNAFFSTFRTPYFISQNLKKYIEKVSWADEFDYEGSNA